MHLGAYRIDLGLGKGYMVDCIYIFLYLCSPIAPSVFGTILQFCFVRVNDGGGPTVTGSGRNEGIP